MTDTNPYPALPGPCQPIGCDNGIHVPGCPFEAIDADAAGFCSTCGGDSGWYDSDEWVNCSECWMATDPRDGGA